jgi:hypothetical protein
VLLLRGGGRLMKPFQQLYLPENQRLAQGKNIMGQNADEIVVEP